MSSRDSIKVVCRIRPENAIEKGGSYKRCVEHTKQDIQVTVSALMSPWLLIYLLKSFCLK